MGDDGIETQGKIVVSVSVSWREMGMDPQRGGGVLDSAPSTLHIAAFASGVSGSRDIVGAPLGRREVSVLRESSLAEGGVCGVDIEEMAGLSQRIVVAQGRMVHQRSAVSELGEQPERVGAELVELDAGEGAGDGRRGAEAAAFSEGGELLMDGTDVIPESVDAVLEVSGEEVDEEQPDIEATIAALAVDADALCDRREKLALSQIGDDGGAFVKSIGDASGIFGGGSDMNR